MSHRDPTVDDLTADQRAALSLSVLEKSVAAAASASSAQGTLDAFLHAPQETSADFVRSFLAMSPAERLAVLTEELEPSDGTTESAGVPPVVELLLNEKPSTHDVDISLAARPAERPTNEVMGSVDVADLADVEEIDMNAVEDVHTGRMVAFFAYGDTTGTTAFDNYVDDAEDEDNFIFRGAARDAADAEKLPVEIDAQEMAALLKNVSALDDFLSLESADDVHKQIPNRNAEMQASATEATANASGDEISKAHSSDEGTEEDEDEGSVLELPGLNDDEDGESQGVCAPPPSSPPHSLRPRGSVTIDQPMRESLRAIADEADDVVYKFSLDPLHNYDADLVGPSFRRGEDRKQLQ